MWTLCLKKCGPCLKKCGLCLKKTRTELKKRGLSYGSAFGLGVFEIFPEKGPRKKISWDTRNDLIVRGHRSELEVCLW